MTFKLVLVCGSHGNQAGPPLKPSAACLALAREVSSSPLLKLSFGTAFPATNQWAVHFCGMQTCKREMSAQALLPGVGTLSQGLAGHLRESFSQLSQPLTNCFGNCKVDIWEMSKLNGMVMGKCNNGIDLQFC